MLKNIFTTLGNDITTLKLEEVNIFYLDQFSQCCQPLRYLRKMSFLNCSIRTEGNLRLAHLPSLEKVFLFKTSLDVLKIFQGHESIKKVFFACEDPQNQDWNRYENITSTLPNLLRR